jgi:4-amino-4-deoxy-L-arabinose transferase-like glycosyltransferase
MKQKSIYFYLAVLTIFLGICSPLLFVHGMFMDGAIYAVIAKNMALGKGTFWIPYFSDTLFPVFYEHPPLAMWLESLFFRLFGNAVLIERLYSVLCIIIIGFLIVKIWKEIVNETFTAWFPLLLFVCFPIITWTATNNMLENTMSVFICTSILLYLVGIRKKKYCFILFAGLSLCLGVLSKGVVAFFPWTFPFWIWLFSRKISFKRCVIDTFTLIISTLLPLVLCYVLSENARFFFDSYLQNQLFSSVTGMIQTVESRFFIFKRLWDNLIPCLILIAGILIFLISKKRTVLLKNQMRNALLFLSLSLCGIVPIMLSLKQSGFYIVPSYPFLAIALALPFQPYIQQLMEKINASSKGFRVFKIVSCVLLLSVIVFSFSQKGKIGRDKQDLQIVFECNKRIPPNTTISIDRNAHSKWGFHAYFARYENITLDAHHANEYYLHDKNLPFSLSEEDYVSVFEMENFVLLKR